MSIPFVSAFICSYHVNFAFFFFFCVSVSFFFVEVAHVLTLITSFQVTRTHTPCILCVYLWCCMHCNFFFHQQITTIHCTMELIIAALKQIIFNVLTAFFCVFLWLLLCCILRVCLCACCYLAK